jgi:hypothetical protein
MNHSKNIIQELDGGLILRRSSFEDREALAKFNGTIHADPGEDFSEHAANDVRILLSGQHPTFNGGDFTIVEDPKTGQIVSSLCLIDQTWSYDGIEFEVGRPELVGTHQDYRRRGLVRQQFETVHQWSAERGQKLQAITGIPWYYRQFGYEMAVNLGGSRRGYLPNIPALEEDQQEPYRFRPVQEEDIPFVTKLYNHGRKRQLLSCVRNEKTWYYELIFRPQQVDQHFDMQIIENLMGQSVGYLLLRRGIFGGQLFLQGFEMMEGLSWFEAAHCVLRKLEQIGKDYAQIKSTPEKPVEMNVLVFNLGEDHPVYHVIPHRIPLKYDPYAFYIRVPDLPDFLTLISPVLEERLAQSYMAGHNGELKLNFFTSGVSLNFERGKLIDVQAWENPGFEKSSANFPNLTFLQLLFGYRDVQQLEDAYADLYFRQEDAKILLNSLFPRKPSHVMELS